MDLIKDLAHLFKELVTDLAYLTAAPAKDVWAMLVVDVQYFIHAHPVGAAVLACLLIAAVAGIVKRRALQRRLNRGDKS